MIIVGGFALVVTLIASLVLWSASGRRFDDNVAGFARAPVGCDTTLDFDRSGEFILYVETTGKFDELVGECDADTRYARGASDDLRPDLTLVDPNGDVVELDEGTGTDYKISGFVGSSYRLVQIDTPGDHVLTVEAVDGPAFAIAVGHGPNDGVALLRWGAIITAIIGLIVSGVLLVLGSKRSPAMATPQDPWTPQPAAFPSSPPGFPVPPPTTGERGPAGFGPLPPSLPAAPPPPPSSGGQQWGPPRSG